MGFVGVYRALYDYEPRADNELAIQDGDTLFILETGGGDDWWRAKKKATNDEDEEPEGLIPNNYIEQAQPVGQARCLYDYGRQTDEELSFSEGTSLDVYDTTDPEWTLVGVDGEFGFVPANYIEVHEDASPAKPPRPQSGRQSETQAVPVPAPAERPSSQKPAAALAGIIQQKTGPSPTEARPPARQSTPEPADNEEKSPSLPQRSNLRSLSPSTPPAHLQSSTHLPLSEPPGVMASPNQNQLRQFGNAEPTSPSGYRLYNIHEMISHLGKNKKMPTTLGINLARGVIMVAPEKSQDGPQKEWTAEKLTHYSIEGKHVFVELVRPSKSLDLHAGAKDTAQEIVSALGELSGMSRAEGLREVIQAGSGGKGQKKGHMLFEFMAQGDDEVTVADGDEVVVIDDTKSEEWMMVRRLRNGKEGVVPSSYVKITGFVESPARNNDLEQLRSTVEQNRIEEERATREAIKRSKRETRSDRDQVDTKSYPTPEKVRMWTDRTGSFKVEAEFLGLKDGKFHLHKVNGIKIAVHASKLSVEDLEFVERETGQSLDEDKPLSDIKRRSTEKRKLQERDSSLRQSRQRAGAAVDPQPPKYDWFDFFLQCGVNLQICERYASAFARDQMGEENMEDIDPTLLRTLGLKEGDILRVMKFLDDKFSRSRDKKQPSGADDDHDATNGIFSGPGGILRNNTRKGRPAPAVENHDTVDPRAFEQNAIRKEKPTPESRQTPIASASTSQGREAAGFGDDAWDVKPSKQLSSPQPASPPAQSLAPAAAPLPLQQRPAPTGAMAELSLLSPPLHPTPAAPQLVSETSQPQPQQQQQQQQQPSTAQQAFTTAPQRPQVTGADRTFFDQISQQPKQSIQPPNQPQQSSVPRQRPPAPPQPQHSTSLLPPPPGRPSSAPQQQQASAFGPPPLQPQTTGIQPQPANPGQSTNEPHQQRFQQPFNNPHIQPQLTGFGFGFGQQNGIQNQNQFPPVQPQQTGPAQSQQSFYPQQQFQPQPPLLNGQQTGTPFADPPRAPFQPLQPQQTGYQPGFGQPPRQIPQSTGVNSYLPQSLQAQSTGVNGFSGPNNFSGYGSQNTSQSPPSLPPQSQAAQPLQPQKTGPPPPIKFGVSGSAQKLTPQATGRANLANATPQNPFGF